MPIDMNDTVSLMQAIDQVKEPASFLLDNFFNQIPPVATTSTIAVEYRKGARRLAPFVAKGASGVNVTRTTSKIDTYTPPMMAPRRIINPEDIAGRGFGENIYSVTTPAQRAETMQARDMVDLQSMIVNRKNKMAADILTTGKCEIKGYADDGKMELVDAIEFSEWENKTAPTTHWNDKSATIYEEIRKASQDIQEGSGKVPTIAVCGANVPKYLLNNQELKDWIMVPNRQNLSIVGFAPRIVSPQVMYVGTIQSLNLEIYCYQEKYLDDDGELKPFIGDNDFVMALPGFGRQLHGAVTLVNTDSKRFETYVGQYVPRYTANDNAVNLTMYSRCVLAPESVDDWAVIKTMGE